MGGERMSRGPTFSPTPSHRAMQHAPPPGHMFAGARATPSPYTDVDEFGPSPFLPEDASPSAHAAGLPPAFDGGPGMLVSPEFLTHAPLDAHAHAHHALAHAHAHAHLHPHARLHAPYPPQLVRGHSVPVLPQRPDQHAHAPFQPFGRPASQQGMRDGPAHPPGPHRVHPPPQRMAPQRHNSLQPQQRAGSPHFVAGDVFGHDPHVRPATAIGMNMAGPSRPMGYDFASDMYAMPQGISPARAMGPAPQQPPRFSPGGVFDPHRTPTQQHAAPGAMAIPSSATSATTATTTTADDSSAAGSVRTLRGRRPASSSDDEEDSPTKANGVRLPATRAALERPNTIEMPVRNALPPKKPVLVAAAAPPPKPVRPLVKPAVSAGRTSAKFAKVAEDPGVEGIPPGPRPMERPGPSFACIIGQAILRSSAGGLSLEHIYRYVETAYPFFKSGDGAWRNSVRHNLSIHKMFETIPRTEKFPPGKGGIWIIHEDEKCHWPEEDKFIKNFPSTHAHHAVCRQTLHERAKEQEARDKAAREGKVYVPKKGKKGRKGPAKDDGEDSGTDMVRSSSFGVGGLSIQRSHSAQSAAGQMPPPLMHPPPIAYRQTLPSSPPHAQFPHAAFDFDDDGDFVPVEAVEAVPAQLLAPLDPASTPAPVPHAVPHDHMMGPPRIVRRDKRVVSDDDENVFAAGPPKRVRLAEPAPLSPIDPHPQPADLFHPDDMYITPARERSAQAAGGTAARHSLGSSAFKTPALVNTSSSPGSSPMPPTVTRGGPAHLPSSLQQAWTHDDMVAPSAAPGSASSPAAGLDAAFDLKPRARKPRISDDDLPPPAAPHFGRGGPNGHAPSSPPARVPPKTPVTRSSAAVGTPRAVNALRTPGITTKTPLFCGSPAAAPPPTGAHLSTPLWEMGGILERMNSYAPESPLRTPRSPVPPTSPTRYSILLDSGASPKPRREFSV